MSDITYGIIPEGYKAEHGQQVHFVTNNVYKQYTQPEGRDTDSQVPQAGQCIIQPTAAFNGGDYPDGNTDDDT